MTFLKIKGRKGSNMNRCFKTSVTNIVRHYGTKPSLQQITELVKQTVDNCCTLGITPHNYQQTYVANNFMKMISNTMMLPEEELLIENTREIRKRND